MVAYGGKGRVVFMEEEGRGAVSKGDARMGGVGGEDDFVRRGRVVLARKSPLSRSDFRVGIGVAGVHRRVCGNTQPRGGEAGGNDGGGGE